jgi:hypothetical protein
MGIPIGSPALDSSRLLHQSGGDVFAWVIGAYVLAVLLVVCAELVMVVSVGGARSRGQFRRGRPARLLVARGGPELYDV